MDIAGLDLIIISEYGHKYYKTSRCEARELLFALKKSFLSGITGPVSIKAISSRASLP